MHNPEQISSVDLGDGLNFVFPVESLQVTKSRPKNRDRNTSETGFASKSIAGKMLVHRVSHFHFSVSI